VDLSVKTALFSLPDTLAAAAGADDLGPAEAADDLERRAILNGVSAPGTVLIGIRRLANGGETISREFGGAHGDPLVLR
jgi:hypothetical protein